MYTATPDIQIGTYPDLWQKGRYRAELGVDVALGFEDVDAALRKLGYEIVDADQYGLSYSHSKDSKRTAEVDQMDEQAEYTRLKLINADLDWASVPAAEDYLVSIYDRICQLVTGPNREFDYKKSNYPIFEDGQIPIPIELYEKEI